MKQKKKKSSRRRAGCALLVSMTLILQAAQPSWVYAQQDAEGLCSHHPEHTEECGYSSEEGIPCTYTCMECAEEEAKKAEEEAARKAAEEAEKAAQEEAERARQAIQQVQALIDALPETDGITAENLEIVKEQLAAIDTAKAGLTEEQQASLDLTRYTAAAEKVLAVEAEQEVEERARQAIQQVQFLIDALPEADTVWELMQEPETNTDTLAEIYEQVGAAVAAYDALTEEQQALIGNDRVGRMEALISCFAADTAVLANGIAAVDVTGLGSYDSLFEALQEALNKKPEMPLDWVWVFNICEDSSLNGTLYFNNLEMKTVLNLLGQTLNGNFTLVLDWYNRAVELNGPGVIEGNLDLGNAILTAPLTVKGNITGNTLNVEGSGTLEVYGDISNLSDGIYAGVEIRCYGTISNADVKSGTVLSGVWIDSLTANGNPVDSLDKIGNSTMDLGTVVSDSVILKAEVPSAFSDVKVEITGGKETVRGNAGENVEVPLNYGENTLKLTVTRGDASRTYELKVTKEKEKQNPPKVAINYEMETLDADITEGLEYSTDGGANWQDCGFDMNLENLGWNGDKEKTIQVRYKETAQDAASDSVTVTIPAKPMLQIEKIEEESSASILSVRVSGNPEGSRVMYTLIDSSDRNNSRFDQDSGKFTQLKAGRTYKVFAYCCATENSFKGDTESVYITTSEAQYTITIPKETLTAGDGISGAMISVNTGQSFDLGHNGQVNVKVKDDGAVSADGKLTLTRQNDPQNKSITSAMLVNGAEFTDITKNVATFKAADDPGVSVFFAAPEEAEIAAGEYSGTVTFEVFYSE